MTKTLIDALPTPQSDIVYWDAALPGFGVKVTPKGRKVFIVLYRTGGAGSKSVQVYHRLMRSATLHHARVAAQKVFAARLDGRDPAAEKREKKRRVVADRVDDLLVPSSTNVYPTIPIPGRNPQQNAAPRSRTARRALEKAIVKLSPSALTSCPRWAAICCRDFVVDANDSMGAQVTQLCATRRRIFKIGDKCGY